MCMKIMEMNKIIRLEHQIIRLEYQKIRLSDYQFIKLLDY